VSPIWHSTKLILKIKKIFAECQITGTRQSAFTKRWYFLFFSLTLSQPRRLRRRLPPRPAAPPRPRRARVRVRSRSPAPTPRSPRPRPRHAPAASPPCLPSLCPRRVPAASPSCVPSSCPRSALVVPPPPRPMTRRLVRDPSIRPRPVVPPVGYD
jgi:hypothetical protein